MAGRLTAGAVRFTIVVVVDAIPLIAIPLPILAHWIRVDNQRDEAMSRFGSAEWARMSPAERLITLLSTLALFLYVAVVSGRGDAPNALAAGALILFAARLAIDFYAGLRFPERRGKR